MAGLFPVILTKLPDAFLLDGGAKGFGHHAAQELEQTFSGILILTRNWSNPTDRQDSLLNNVQSGHEDIGTQPIVLSPRAGRYNRFCGDKNLKLQMVFRISLLR
jgi:hypothetical protein